MVCSLIPSAVNPISWQDHEAPLSQAVFLLESRVKQVCPSSICFFWSHFRADYMWESPFTLNLLKPYWHLILKAIIPHWRGMVISVLAESLLAQFVVFIDCFCFSLIKQKAHTIRCQLNSLRLSGRWILSPLERWASFFQSLCFTKLTTCCQQPHMHDTDRGVALIWMSLIKKVNICLSITQLLFQAHTVFAYLPQTAHPLLENRHSFCSTALMQCSDGQRN